MDQLSNTFKALADPTRRAILARLANGDASVTELAEPFEMSLPAVSRHLKVLQKAGLITRGREAQRRPCRFEPARLREATDWVDRHRRMWEARYERLGQLLGELQAQATPQTHTAKKKENRYVRTDRRK